MKTKFQFEEIMKAILLIAALVGVVHSQQGPARANYFIHSISAERWNKYICESCKYNYHPVCGNNWRTYPNACMFSCEAQKVSGLKILHRGECITRRYQERSLYDLGCPECRIEPKTLVCGHNEITYYNVCYFDCYRRKYGMKHLKIAHTGPCFIDQEHHLKRQGETETCICNRETHQGIFLRHQVAFRVKKVCGAVTVYNKCQYDCEIKESGFQKYPGICENIEMYKHPAMDIQHRITYNPCRCTTENATVCSISRRFETETLTDGHLRKNNCFSSCEREEEVSIDKCTPKNCGCDSKYEPTCAMKLFKDVCHFECYRRISRPSLTLHGVVSCPNLSHQQN